MNYGKHYIGEKINHLTILEKLEEKDKYGNKLWLCKCDCGNITKLNSSALANVKGCGCKIDNIKHNMSKTKLYRSWNRMKNRCYAKSMACYELYGGRGIKVCDEWKNNFLSFKEWALNNGYKENLSLDRINVDGDYEPNNCRWITMFEQASNKRTNVFYTINGITKTQTQWARYYNIPITNLRRRLSSGWNIEDALTKPIKKRG